MPWLKNNHITQWLLLGSLLLQTVTELVGVARSADAAGKPGEPIDTSSLCLRFFRDAFLSYGEEPIMSRLNQISCFLFLTDNVCLIFFLFSSFVIRFCRGEKLYATTDT